MLSLSQCFDFTDLMPEEIVLGVSLAPRHDLLLHSYQLALERSNMIAVRDRIIADLRCFLDLGAKARAADLLLVLRMFLSQHLKTICKMAREAELSQSLCSRTMTGELAAKFSSASPAAVIAAHGVLRSTGDIVLFPFGHTRKAKQRRDGTVSVIAPQPVDLHQFTTERRKMRPQPER